MTDLQRLEDRLDHIEYNSLKHIEDKVTRTERVVYALGGVIIGTGVLEVQQIFGW